MSAPSSVGDRLQQLPWGEARGAFAVAAAQGGLSEAAADGYEGDGTAEQLVDSAWAVLSFDPEAWSRLSEVVADYYRSAGWRRSYVDSESLAEPLDEPAHACFLAAVALLHGSSDIAAAVYTLVSCWCAQSELDRQMAVLSLLEAEGSRLQFNYGQMTPAVSNTALARGLIDRIRL